MSLKKAIKKQLDGLPEENIIVEPMKRNTAACIGLSSVVIENKYPGSTMIVLSADHLIQDKNKFIDILSKAIMIAATGKNLLL